MKFNKAIIIALVAVFAATGVSFAVDDYCYPLTGSKDYPCEVFLGCPPPGDQNDIDFCIPEEPHNALLNICCCEEVDPDSDTFIPGTEIAIKYSIVDETQGVYFARFYDHEVNPLNNNSDPKVLGKVFEAWDKDCVTPEDLSPAATCENMADDSNLITWETDWWKNGPNAAGRNGVEGEYDWDGFVYKAKNGNYHTADGIEPPDAFDPHAEDANYYCTVTGNDQIVEMWTVETNPASGGLASQAGTRDAGYHVDFEEFDTCWWVFNLPYLVMNWAEAVNHQNETVQIKVSLIALPDSGVSICSDAVPVCFCIVDAAVICDNDQEVWPAMRKMYFPYVISTKVGGSWTSGIGVSNIDTSIKHADMEATFIFIDSAGNVFSGTKKGFDSQVFSAVFNNPGQSNTIVDMFGWDDIAKHDPVVASGAGVLRVQTNFAADGYQYNMFVAPNGQCFGSGILPRTQLGIFAWRMPGDGVLEGDDWDDHVPFNW